MVLDSLNGFRPARVPGAPGWVSPDTLSPMDVSGSKLAICIDGGIISVDLQSRSATEIRIDGAGREEAVVVDPPLVFCAHSREDGRGLIISRIESPTNKRSESVYQRVVDMVTDANPPPGPHLRYNRPRAVSLAVIDDRLFVSCGPQILVFDKQNLTQKWETPINLPCRLIHVRRWKPPGDDQHYGTPKDSYLVWAVGATINGRQPNTWTTSLYKIAVVK